MRYARTLASLVLFLTHLAEQKSAYSVNFDAMHGLSIQVDRLKAELSAGGSDRAAKRVVLDILGGVMDWEGSLWEKAERANTSSSTSLRSVIFAPTEGFRPPSTSRKRSHTSNGASAWSPSPASEVSSRSPKRNGATESSRTKER